MSGHHVAVLVTRRYAERATSIVVLAPRRAVTAAERRKWMGAAFGLAAIDDAVAAGVTVERVYPRPDIDGVVIVLDHPSYPWVDDLTEPPLLRPGDTFVPRPDPTETIGDPE